MVVVGRPGTTPEVGPSEDRLPPSAVQRVGKTSSTRSRSFTYTSLSARVTPTTPGTYPVFAFASRGARLAAARNMAEPHDLTITRVGLLRVT